MVINYTGKRGTFVQMNIAYTAKTPRVHGVTRTPALTVNTVLSRTGTGLRRDGAITDSAPTICAGLSRDPRSITACTDFNGYRHDGHFTTVIPTDPATAL